MQSAIQFQQQAAHLEQQLAVVSSVEEQITILDKLLQLYVFIDTDKASACLEQFKAAIPSIDFDTAYLFRLYCHQGLLYNQLLQFDSAKNEYLKALNLGPEAASSAARIDVHIDYIATLINLGEFNESYHFISTAYQLLKHKPHSIQQHRLHVREGRWHLHLSNFTEALRLFLEAEKGMSQHELTMKDYYLWSSIYSGIGHVHYANDEYRKSVKAHLHALDICNQYGMKHTKVWHYAEIGRCYLTMGELSKAEVYLSLTLSSDGDSNLPAKISAWANIGQCAFLQSDYEQALSRYEDAERVYLEKESDNLHNLVTIELWRAEIYEAIKQPSSQEKHLFQALHYAEKAQQPKLVYQSCKDLSDFYAKRNSYKQAYIYLQLYNEFANAHSQSQSIHVHKAMELEVKYETEKRKYESEQYQNQALLLQMKALRAQIKPHFFSNSLNSIQSYIHQSGNEQASSLLSDFANYMRDCLNYSELELITVEDEIQFLKEYLRLNQRLRMEDRLSYEVCVDEEVEEDIILMPTMLIQPYVENAIEHGVRSLDTGHVEVHFSMYDEFILQCTILDNGIGLEEAARRNQKRRKASMSPNGKPNGTQLTRQRIELLYKQMGKAVPANLVSVQNRYEKGKQNGVQATIRIPISGHP